MKLNKQILEAINKGIHLALDDYEDDNELSSTKSNIIKNANLIKDRLDMEHWAVDLGLPSGTLWSKYNVGVNPDKLSNILSSWYGWYFAWGEVEHKYFFEENNYKWFKGKNHKLTKYNTQKSLGDVDDLIRLRINDDAAFRNMPSFKGYIAQMPDYNDLYELCMYTTCKSVRDYNRISGLSGVVITSKVNGNEIFLPYSGLTYRGISTDHKGYDNNYWIKIAALNKRARYFGFDRFNDNNISNMYNAKTLIGLMSKTPDLDRWKGLSIRAIYQRELN